MKRWLFSALLLVVGCGVSPQPTPIYIPLASTPRDVIVDTDVSVDDILALLYLLSRPDVNVRAITISGTGITHCDEGIRNVRAILETLERTTIPIACGRETPLHGNHAFPSEWREAAGNFFGVNLLPAQFVVPNENAVELLKRALEARDTPVTILTLGPLTNLADAFKQNQTLTQNIEMVYVMGGAVNVSGNVDAAKNAEWNFYIDPAAVDQVFASSVPITIVPLDVTNQVPVSPWMLIHLYKFKRIPAERLAERLLQNQRAEIERGTLYLWDVVAAFVFTDSSAATIQEMNVEIETGTGQLKQTVQGKHVRVVTNMDVPRFEAVFLQTLNGQFK